MRKIILDSSVQPSHAEVIRIVKDAVHARDLMVHEIKVKIDSRVDEITKLQYEAVNNEASYKKMLELLKDIKSYRITR